MCNHHHYLIPEHFILFFFRTFYYLKATPPIKPLVLMIPQPQPLETINLLPVSMDLLILDISYKRNHTICGLLCLASFPWLKVFKFHPCGNMCQFFIIIHSLLTNSIWYRYFTFCLSVNQVMDIWVVPFFFFLAIRNNAAMNIEIQVFVWTCLLNCLEVEFLAIW